MLEWILFVIAAFLILGGVVIAAIATFGTYRFRYVLNRMHAAALIDTLSLSLIVLGTMFLCNGTFSTGWEAFFCILKLFLVVVFFWLASPVSGHLISRLEVTTNEKVKDECEVQE